MCEASPKGSEWGGICQGVMAELDSESVSMQSTRLMLESF